MTIITGTEYKANQGKYIKRAQERERVIISSHGSYVELKLVPETDKDVVEHINAKSFLATSARIDKAARECSHAHNAHKGSVPLCLLYKT